MADKAADVKVVSSVDELPGGILPQGESPQEAMEGLYEALGSEEEFAEDPEGEDSPTGDEPKPKKAEEDAGSEDEDEDEDASEDAEEADDDEDESEDSDEDESDDGDDADDDSGDLSDETVVKGVPLPGGETTEVTIGELKAGYSRQADYTRKTQKLAAEHGEAMQGVREVREEYGTKLAQVSEILEKMGPQMPDPELRHTNPGEYAAQVAEHQAFKESLGALGAAQDEISAEKAAEQKQAQEAYALQEWDKLLTAVPEWREQAVATQELAELRQFAIEEFQFTPEEIDSVADSRLLLLLRRSHKLQQTQSKAQQKVEEKKAEAKERLKPGSRKTKASAKTRKRKQQRAADRRAMTSGSVHDAARAIELALANEE